MMASLYHWTIILSYSILLFFHHFQTILHHVDLPLSTKNDMISPKGINRKLIYNLNHYGEHEMDKITFCGKTDGISVEQIVRFGEFNMKVKHFHNQYEIFYIIEGERQFFFNNRHYIAHSGDLILIDTNLIHMTKAVSTQDLGYNRVILYIDYEKMQEFDQKYPGLELVRFFHDNYGMYHLNAEQQRLFLMLYRDLRICMTHKDSNYSIGVDLAIMNWLFRLQSELSHQHSNVPSLQDNSRCKTVYAVADYLSENCEKNISLDELAEHFFLSKYYICRIFKEITNCTITEYINIHRIRKAKRLLEETSLSISQIASRLGFESLTYFERTFKTYMNRSPLRYRKTLDTITPDRERLGVLDDTSYLHR